MRNSPLVSFLTLAFGISWSIAGIGAWSGVDTTHSAYVFVAGLCMLGPAAAAIFQWRLIDRAPWSALALHPRLINWGGMGLTVALALCIVPLALLTSSIFGDVFLVPGFGHVEVSGERFSNTISTIIKDQGLAAPSSATERMAALPGAAILLLIMVGASFSAFTVNLPFMLGEELGWRGYLFASASRWSAAKRVAFTGPVWGIWHAPLILLGHNYPGHPFVGILLMMVFCTLLAVLFDLSRQRSNSVWGPCVLHGIINGSAGAFILFAWDGHVLLASPAGVAGLVALLLLCILVFTFDGSYRRTFFRPTATA